MYITFANSETLGVSLVKEQKRVYSLPTMWELTVESDTDLTSSELDALLVAENISVLSYYNGIETKTLSGYDTVDFVMKTVTETGVSLCIKLLKEEENPSTANAVPLPAGFIGALLPSGRNSL